MPPRPRTVGGCITGWVMTRVGEGGPVTPFDDAEFWELEEEEEEEHEVRTMTMSLSCMRDSP